MHVEQSDVPAAEARRVSVIVPTKNRSALLRRALASIRAVECDGVMLEIIVADNGSTDDTESVTREFGAHFVQALVPGAAAARNAGLRAATGEFLAFLDDDDVWLPGHLRPHLDLLQLRPDLTAVVSQVQNTDYYMTSCGPPWPASLPPDGNCFVRFLAFFPQIGATVARASVLESVGYLDESLLSDEDWDWHLRLALRHRIGFVAAPSVLFRQRPPAASDELEWMRLPYFRTVLLRNLRRAHWRRDCLQPAASALIKSHGAFAGYLLRAAASHIAAGDQTKARRALGWAFRVSPPHVIYTLIVNGEIRRSIRTLLSW